MEIRLGKVAIPPPPDPGAAAYFEASEGQACLYRQGFGALAIRGGREIILDLAPEAEELDVRLTVMGLALALMLHQRGLTVLHASGVVMGGGAVAFLGTSGWGKSTTAAALYAAGCGIVADDVVALTVEDSVPPMVMPGFPRLRLTTEVIRHLGSDLRYRRQDYFDKKYITAAERNFPEQPLPLRAIYVLAEGETLAIEPIPAPEALIELVRHTYRMTLVHHLKGESSFRNCAQLVQKIPIRRLQVPRSLELLPDMVRLVQQYQERETSLASTG